MGRALALLTLALLGCGGPPSAAERGSTAAAERRWAEAFAAYDRALEREPERLDLRRERVRAALLSGSLPEHERRLREELDEASANQALRYELALAIATAGEAGSDERAAELLTTVAAALPRAAEVRYRLGLLRLEQERFDEAIVELEQALELEPDRPSYRVALAGALAEVPAQTAQARAVLARLPELEPSEGDLERGRAILDGLNLPLQRVPLALRQSYLEAIEALGEESASMGEAVQLIDAALAEAPDCEPLLVLSGLSAVRLGQLGRARAAFQRATELFAEDPLPWIELASLEEQSDRPVEAEADLRRALEADPLSLDAWGELGRLRYQRQRYAEAAEAFQRLLRLDGGRTITTLWLGRALRRAQRDEEAERVYLTMLEHHPRNYEACLQLGHIYRQRRLQETDRERSAQLVERARHWYSQALEERPQDPLIQRMLSSLEESGEP